MIKSLLPILFCCCFAPMHDPSKRQADLSLS